MIQIGKIFASIIVVICSLYLGLLTISKALNSEADDAILNIVSEIEKRGSKDIALTIKSLSVYRKKIFFVISPLPLIYVKNHRSILYYSQFPLGPDYVYNLRDKTWSYEE